MSELVIRPSDVDVREVLVGELVAPGIVHDLCGEWHSYTDGELIICCGCGHAHDADGSCMADGPCGSHLCCIN